MGFRSGIDGNGDVYVEDDGYRPCERCSRQFSETEGTDEVQDKLLCDDCLDELEQLAAEGKDEDGKPCQCEPPDANGDGGYTCLAHAAAQWLEECREETQRKLRERERIREQGGRFPTPYERELMEKAKAEGKPAPKLDAHNPQHGPPTFEENPPRRSKA